MHTTNSINIAVKGDKVLLLQLHEDEKHVSLIIDTLICCHHLTTVDLSFIEQQVSTPQCFPAEVLLGHVEILYVDQHNFKQNM